MEMVVAGVADTLDRWIMGQTIIKRQEIAPTVMAMDGGRVIVDATLRNRCQPYVIDMRDIKTQRPFIFFIIDVQRIHHIPEEDGDD